MIQRASCTSTEPGTSDRMYKELLKVNVFTFFYWISADKNLHNFFWFLNVLKLCLNFIFPIFRFYIPRFPMCSQSPLNIHEYTDKKRSMNKETDIQNTVSLFVIIISVNKKDKGTSDSGSPNKHKQEFVFMAKCLGIE